MTERKPPGMSWESWIDRLIRQGMERGDFDDLPGAGKPISDLNRPRDELWWVKEKLRREDVSYLPPTLQIRKDVEDALAAAERAPSEREVRRIIAEINERISAVNSRVTHGPPSTVMRLDVEAEVDRWRARHGEAPST